MFSCHFIKWQTNEWQRGAGKLNSNTQFNAWMDQMVLNIENVVIVFFLFATIKIAQSAHMHKQIHGL